MTEEDHLYRKCRHFHVSWKSNFLQYRCFSYMNNNFIKIQNINKFWVMVHIWNSSSFYEKQFNDIRHRCLQPLLRIKNSSLWINWFHLDWQQSVTNQRDRHKTINKQQLNSSFSLVAAEAAGWLTSSAKSFFFRLNQIIDNLEKNHAQAVKSQTSSLCPFRVSRKQGIVNSRNKRSKFDLQCVCGQRQKNAHL